jgi:hypothetical protein
MELVSFNIHLKIIGEQIKSISNYLLMFFENRIQKQIGSQRKATRLLREE